MSDLKQRRSWSLRMEIIEERFHRLLRFAEKRAVPEIHRQYRADLQVIVDEMRAG